VLSPAALVLKDSINQRQHKERQLMVGSHILHDQKQHMQKLHQLNWLVEDVGALFSLVGSLEFL